MKLKKKLIKVKRLSISLPNKKRQSNYNNCKVNDENKKKCINLPSQSTQYYAKTNLKSIMYYQQCRKTNANVYAR